jgi:hypothetical protein
MSHFFRNFTMVLALTGVGLIGETSVAFAAAGSPPQGPIEAVHTGANLKFACGQGVKGFDQVVGEEMLRAMLIVQCRAVVGAVVELVGAGQYALDDAPIWQCVENREDHDALTAAFVKWVGRNPALLRKPAAVAFVEAIEMSQKCR